MVTEELARDVGVGAEDKSGEDSEAIAEKWKKFKPLMESGELLESYLPWRGVEEKSITEYGLKQITKMGVFSDETVHLNFKTDLHTPGGFLFVCPRFFRGQGLSMEISAFIEFSKIISKDLKSYESSLGLKEDETIEIVILHPLMVTQTGVPDYSCRAPHPSLLFKIVKSKKLYK